MRPLELNQFLGDFKAYSDSRCELELNPDELSVGDIFYIPSQLVVPVDAILLENESYFDFASFSGESAPVKISRGSKVACGTRVLGKTVKLEARSDLKTSSVAKLTKTINAILTRPDQFEQAIDRGAMYFTWALTITALIFLLGSYRYFTLETQVSRLLAFFVVACPCALSIVVPLAQRLFVKQALKQSVVVKSVTDLEKLAEVDTVIFDKTGTLTHLLEGEMHWLPENPDDREKRIILSLEKDSEHPIANLVRTNFRCELKALELDNTRELPSQGVEGSYEGALYFFGKKTAKDPLGLYKNNKLLYTVSLSERLHPEARASLEELRNSNKTLRLFSGDNEDRVDAIAQQLGLKSEEVIGRCTPLDKQQLVAILRHKDINVFLWVMEPMMP